MFAAVISKVLSLKSGTVLIAALAASTINSLPAGSEQLAHVLVSGAARPPLGWVEFWARQPGECAGTTTAPRDLALSPKAWIYLVRVNNWVNETINGYGDCEDYVLLKRRMLIQSGWPREALLITVVHDQNGKGHAVLTVTTDRGDYVLDNQNTDILLWSETGYRFFKRQSQSNPNVWVSLSDPQRAIATATSR